MQKEKIIHWAILGTGSVAVCGKKGDVNISVDPADVTCIKCFRTRIADMKKQFVKLFPKKELQNQLHV